MQILILGLVLFLAPHILTSFRDTRAELIKRFGQRAYRTVYAIVSTLGFALIVFGFSHYRADDFTQLWTPPAWGRHVAMLLVWIAFIAFASANPKPSRIKGWLRHPMLAGLMAWALAHLLANGDLGGLVLFGAFLAWAVYDRIAVASRGDAGAAPLDHFTRSDGIAVAAGTALYVLMLFLHPVLIGVPVLHG
jgi:uncharacterized membrane protein